MSRGVKELNAGTNRCVTWVGLETRAMTRLLSVSISVTTAANWCVGSGRSAWSCSESTASPAWPRSWGPTPHLSAGQNHHRPRLGGTGLAGQPGDPDAAGGANHRVHRQIDQQGLKPGFHAPREG